MPCSAFRSLNLTKIFAIKMIREQGVIAHPGHFFDFPKGWFLSRQLDSLLLEVVQRRYTAFLAGF